MDEISIILLVFFLALGLFLLPIAIVFIANIVNYKKSDYFKKTQESYFDVRHDKGKFGEYLTSRMLEEIRGYKQFLLNVYVPKIKGTTEIDLILIHESGIYVIESKNYHGWVFGSEQQENWTVTLFGDKYKLYNPIKQNEGHIKWLKRYLHDNNLPYYSVIVFGEKAELKQINIVSKNVFVINQYDLSSVIRSNTLIHGKKLSIKTIDYLYKKLKPLTDVNELTKLKHIIDVQKIKDENIN